MSKKKNKEFKKMEKQISSDSDEVVRMLKIFGGIVLVLVILYFVFAFATGEIKFGEEKKPEPEIQNVEILAGSTFNRPESEYYVLLYDFSSEYNTKCVTLYNLFTSSNSSKLYVVDLSNGFNKNIVVNDKKLVNVQNAENLKVMNPTMLKIENGKTTITKTGIDEVDNFIKGLIK